MKSAINQQEVCDEIVDVENYGYIFSPSIGKRRTIGGKTFFVRGVFKGGQDFETAMKRFAIEQIYKNRR